MRDLTYYQIKHSLAFSFTSHISLSDLSHFNCFEWIWIELSWVEDKITTKDKCVINVDPKILFHKFHVLFLIFRKIHCCCVSYDDEWEWDFCVIFLKNVKITWNSIRDSVVNESWFSCHQSNAPSIWWSNPRHNSSSVTNFVVVREDKISSVHISDGLLWVLSKMLNVLYLLFSPSRRN